MTEGPHEHTCSTRDGAILRGLQWLSREPGGVVVIRTPYDASAHASTARSWTERGYHCVVQDVRGRYASDGVWHPYQHEGGDGLALLRAVRAQHPGLPVLCYGASYAAHTALETARSAQRHGEPTPAALLLLVPALGLAETAWDRHDRPQTRHRIGWWHQHGFTRRARTPLNHAELRSRCADVAELGLLRAARSWGWTGAELEAWSRLWSARRVELGTRYGDLTTPLLLITGHHDFFAADADRLASAWPGPSHLATGPWGHELIGGVPDPDLRAAIRAAGGLGRVIDPWLASHDLPGTPDPWTVLLHARARTRSRFCIHDAAWHHERSRPAGTTAPGAISPEPTKGTAS